jgi:hypothetical protein
MTAGCAAVAIGFVLLSAFYQAVAKAGTRLSRQDAAGRGDEFDCGALLHHRGKSLVAADRTILVGAVLGGYHGARIARRLDPRFIRVGISLLNVGITAAFFFRAAR